MIASAPGKVVLWGEYAVLTGAPAGVMAVDRCAHIHLEPRRQDWLFSSAGFLTPGLRKAGADFSGEPAAGMAESVLQSWGYQSMPLPFALHSDTAAFYLHGNAKLGIGSSSALCTATYRALAELLNRPFNLAEAIAMHRAFQGSKGSGLDVAASWHGGVIRFQDGDAQPQHWPEDLHWQVVFTGESASTGAQVAGFSHWLSEHDPAPVEHLAQCSAALCAAPGSIEAWHAYVGALAELDQTAMLNIYTAPHKKLAGLASDLDLVYKPCGAGGGDIGIALGTDPDALQRFASAADALNFVPLDMEIATNGVRLSH